MTPSIFVRACPPELHRRTLVQFPARIAACPAQRGFRNPSSTTDPAGSTRRRLALAWPGAVGFRSRQPWRRIMRNRDAVPSDSASSRRRGSCHNDTTSEAAGSVRDPARSALDVHHLAACGQVAGNGAGHRDIEIHLSDLHFAGTQVCGNFANIRQTHVGVGQELASTADGSARQLCSALDFARHLIRACICR